MVSPNFRNFVIAPEIEFTGSCRFFLVLDEVADFAFLPLLIFFPLLGW